MNNQNIVAIIPARYGSTRLQAKPLIDLCGKSMIQRVYEQVKKSKLVKDVVVATDHQEIESVVSKFGKVILTPVDLKSGSDRVGFVAKNLTDADIIINIQGDEPLIPPQMIDDAIQLLLTDISIPVSTVVKVIGSSEELFDPGVVKVLVDKNNFAIYFSRLPVPFIRDEEDKNKWHMQHRFFKHFGIYVFRKTFLLHFTNMKETSLEHAEKLEQLRILENGFKIKVSVTDYDSIAVDTAEDAEKVRQLLRNVKDY
ncbi:MAG: 3-deoxy-manno-octulosonate cytidylyltransferase [Ignavibacteriales bacterium]|nr:3-deoxy-manno-octulosonate cytidylyltransferase [Ignavibacteriales bacterium]